MFKPYDFGDWTFGARLPVVEQIDFDGGDGAFAGFAFPALPVVPPPAVVALTRDALVLLVAEAAVSARMDDGHVYTASNEGCACCGHSHDEHLRIKEDIRDIAAGLQAALDAGVVALDLDSLLEAAADMVGLGKASVRDAVGALAEAGGGLPVPVANEPADGDLPADTTTTGAVEVGGRVSGFRADGDDEDWFAVELEAGQEYILIMLRMGENPHTDPLLNLYDDAGVLITSNDDLDFNEDGQAENRNSIIFFTPETSGTYYLGASGWDSSTFTGVGDYTIFVEESDQRPDFTIPEVAAFLTDTFDNQERWDKTTLTYDVSALPEGARTLALLAMEAWAEVSGLTFEAAAAGAAADIVFDDANDTNDGQQAFAQSQSSNGIIQSVRVVVSENWDLNGDGTPNYALNSYRYQTYLHEVGHALGLGHAGPYNGSSSDAETGRDYNVFNQDAWNYTVMSYFDQGEAGTGTPRLVLGLQTADILAIQSVYGVNAETRSGDSVYGFNSTEDGVLDFETTFSDQGIRPPSLAIYDAGGDDTLDMSGYAADQTISLVEGTFSSVGDNTNTPETDDALINNLSIALGTVIENAVGGSGNDTITGNDADNRLTGGLGDDVLDGGEGSDVAVFAGVQADYVVTINDDGTVTISGTEGTDTLRNVETAQFSDGAISLGEFNSVPVAIGDGVLPSSPEDGVRTITTAELLALFSDADGDLLSVTSLSAASGTVVADGNGDYRYTPALDDDTSETLTVTVSDGTATATRTATFDLTPTLDAGRSAIGTAGDDALRGNEGNDRISGLEGADELFGLDGFDFLYGGGGLDRLTGGAGDDRLLGGLGEDVLDGGDGDDLLDGGGGIGTDTLRGGAGADIFQMSERGDIFIEDFTVGEDLVRLLTGPRSGEFIIGTASETAEGDLSVLISVEEGGSISAFGRIVFDGLRLADYDRDAFFDTYEVGFPDDYFDTILL